MQKRENRIRMDLSVRIWGMDINGKVFKTQGRTVNITPIGARIAGVHADLHRGSVVGVACGNSQARFRVIWIGRTGTGSEGHIGVHCMEPGKYIWGVALKRSMERDQIGLEQDQITMHDW
jgi:hypothetical protein